MFYFDVKLGAILTMVSVIVFLIFLLDEAVAAKKNVGFYVSFLIIGMVVATGILYHFFGS